VDDVDAVLDSVCRTAVRLLNAAPGMTRVHVRSGEACIEVERAGGVAGMTMAPPPMVEAAAVVEQVRAAPGQAGEHHVRAPMVGTFYHAPAPGEPPFVAEGDLVEAGQQIGVLEAMKLMNPVEADRRGRVAKILVPDHTSVEYDQLLMLLVLTDEAV
jgi:acetyl-CoA carboxylase biotin carboxyl carrier protein